MIPVGCLPVMATPFKRDETLDAAALGRIVNLNIASGANGVTCFGLASELYKLDDADRALILASVMEEVNGRVPVIVGCEHSGSLAAARRCKQAADMGAGAVMLLPPSFTTPQSSSVRDYFLRCADACNLPVIVQDAPAWTGVSLPIELLLELHEEDPRINSLKLEAPPISAKARAAREAGMAVIGGYGAVHVSEDLALDSVDGFMPGCAFPEVMVRMWRAHMAGDQHRLAADYKAILPLLVAELTDLDTFIEVQKRALVKRGVIDDVTCREPHQSIDTSRLAYLDDLIDKALEVGRDVKSNDDI